MGWVKDGGGGDVTPIFQLIKFNKNQGNKCGGGQSLKISLHGQEPGSVVTKQQHSIPP